MSNYNLSLTGAQINSALNKVHNADTQPTSGSQNMVTSDAVNDAVNDIQFDNLNSNLVKTDISSGTNDTTLASSAAIKTYVDNNQTPTFATGYTYLGSTSASGTASSSGFLIGIAKEGSGSNYTKCSVQIAVGSIIFNSTTSSAAGSACLSIPIATGETYSVTTAAGGSSGRRVEIYFKAFS